MLKSFKHYFLSIALVPLVSNAAFYVEPRASILVVGETPSIGDIGYEVSTDSSEFVPGFVAGIGLSTRLALEVRYTRIGEFSTRKESPTFQIFPADVTLPALRPYELTQRTDLYSLALPVTIYHQNKLTVKLTPVASFEHTRTELHDPNLQTFAVATPLVQRNENEFQPGLEVSAGYALSELTALNLHYFYSPMKNYSAHLFGAGLTLKF